MTGVTRRIIAGGEYVPDEYNARIEFEGYELEDETGRNGWTIDVFDVYHKVIVRIELEAVNDGAVSVLTELIPSKM